MIPLFPRYMNSNHRELPEDNETLKAAPGRTLDMLSKCALGHFRMSQ